jgi:predicted acyl esterase
MAPHKLVEFSTFDGVTLRGNFYLPKQSNAPAIIMTNGLTFLKECASPPRMNGLLQHAECYIVAVSRRMFAECPNFTTGMLGTSQIAFVTLALLC